MKRTTILLLTLCMLFSLFACGSAAAEGYTAGSLDQAIRDAEGGNTDAMVFLGNLYYLGDFNMGVSRDFGKALDWFLKASDAGDPKVLFTIGRMYERGSGIERDQAKAFEWYSKAAERGSKEAKDIIDSDAYKEIKWKANAALLKGTLGDREAVGTGFSMPLYLDTPVIDCDTISMELRIVAVKSGWPYGRYSLWARNLNEEWVELDKFEIEKALENGEPKMYNFSLETPISFKALAVCLSESGMMFTLEHADEFYVDKDCIAAYSDSIPAPAFTPSGAEYPEISATVSSSAFVNPYF